MHLSDEDWLPHTNASLNMHMCSSTGRSPHSSLFGSELVLPYDEELAKQPIYDAENYARSHIKVMHEIQEEVKEKLASSRKVMTDKQHNIAKPINVKEILSW